MHFLAEFYRIRHGVSVSLLRLFLSLFLMTALVACGNADKAVYKFDYFAFGTLISLTIAGEDRESAQRASNALEVEFNRMHHDWHAWQAGPLVSINQALSNGETVELNAEFSDLIPRSLELAALSEGTFHPGMGGLLKLWGFQGDDMPTAPPEQTALDAFLATAPSLDDIVISHPTSKSDKGGVSIHSTNPHFQFDLGGFAKGYGIDQAIAQLKSMGIDNAIVNAGGDLRAIGQRPDRPWRIGIRHPRGPGVMAFLDVKDGESVFTSGDYERYFYFDDQRFHHILDPHTGWPADQAMSVTILTQEAALADAAATALLVAGPEQWREVAASMGIKQAMLVDAQGEIHMLPAMKDRITLTVERIEKLTQAPPHNHAHDEE